MRPCDYTTREEIAWCPGCGNFGIVTAVRNALAELSLAPRNVLLVSGTGQASKLPHYVKANCFGGLHGRALPVASGAKAANRELTVIVSTGDGDCYGEGANHLIAAIRRNVDVTVLVHNNQVYGLTRGQASPTADPGFITPVHRAGVTMQALNPMALAIALECGFVARGFSGEIDHLTELVVAGIRHPGFALIDVLQPCVTYNRHATHRWYRERVYRLDAEEDYTPEDKVAAFMLAGRWGDQIPLGILYRNERRTHGDLTGIDARPPLVERTINDIELQSILHAYA